jgi:hypothetical protein
MTSTRLRTNAATSVATALLLTCLAASGCSDNPQACSTSDDCFSGETCVAGRCQPQTDTDTGNNTQNNSSNPDTSSPDTSTGDDASTGEDSGGQDSGGQDSGGDETCAVDPFTVTCENDDNYDNDEWIDADEFKDTTLGCYGSLEQPEDWSTTINGTMCYDEEGDYFGMNIAPCDAQFRMQVKLTVPEMCIDSEWGLDVRVGGARVPCDEGRDDPYRSMQCVRDGHTETWTIIVKNSNSIWSFKAGVLGASEGESQFDYTLEGKVL